MRLEAKQRHKESTKRQYDLMKMMVEFMKIYLPETTMVPTHPTQCASSYGDFGCFLPNKRTDSEEDEKVFENTRSVTKKDKDEQGKEEKWVVKFFEVGTDEQNNKSGNVLNDFGGIVYGKGNDTWADVGLKHGSYLLLDRILEDGWYFLDESRLSKEPLCRSNLKVHLQFHVDRLETVFSSTSMGDENPICALEDSSRPSHEGYRKSIELLDGNNVGKDASAFISIPFVIKLAIGLNVFLMDPSPPGRILLLVSFDVLSLYGVGSRLVNGVSKELDTAYWGFLGVGTTLDIFQNIILILYRDSRAC
ncbi:hypothetical protein Tco_1055794 [Tanacetum coccineum]|uniref:Uncharacterized protein n=1 Tax=Tanacetum coccineum TaxID=301880 RepID=A0ABQ5H0P1_9ASTR